MDSKQKMFIVILVFAAAAVLFLSIIQFNHYVYQLTNYKLFSYNYSYTESYTTFSYNYSYTESLPHFLSIDQHSPVKNKIIVMLNTPSWFAPVLNPKHMFDECEVSACEFHYKNALKYVSDSDAVILYAVGYSIKNFISLKPKQGQIWIFAVWESPHFSHSQVFDNAIFKDKINWTMTYRLDSDIPVPYSIQTKTDRLSNNYTEIMADKRMLVAQVVSHCSTPSRREQYIRSLKKYIPVTVFGRCGQKSTDKHLFENIQKSYKFYLAFENSLCRDYMTEKFFIWQNKSIVPIVRGDGNYEHFGPKNSYIDTKDFKNISDLAKYIQYLDKNNTAYIEYLKAKENYVYTDVTAVKLKSFCQICKMLHNPDKYTNSYSNVQNWYANGTCRKANDLE